MAKLYRKMLLLAKIESVAGVDEVPTSAANAFLVRGLTPVPISADYVGRDNVRPYMGNSSQLAAGIHRQIEFEMELAGSGTPGTPPAWGPLLKACGFSQTVNASPTEVFYKPISDSIPTLTMYFYIDGVRGKMLGCVGTVVFDFTSKAIPVMRFRFIGEYQAMTDTALPTDANYSSFLAPVTVGKVFSPSFTIHGNAACLQSLSIDMACNLVYRDLVGCGGPSITDRAPTGQVVLEFPSVATYAWDEAIKNSTEGTLAFTHGTTAGNIITVECPVVTCNNASFTNQDGIVMLSLGLSVNPSLGNDEIVITAA